MGRECLFSELPLACQECYYLHCGYVHMDGKNYYECRMKNWDVRRDFKNGKSCVEGLVVE